MRLVIYLGKMLKIKVSVDLGCADIRMAEQFLHATQIAAGLQHVRSKTVPQCVAPCSFFDPGPFSSPFYCFLQNRFKNMMTHMLTCSWIL